MKIKLAKITKNTKSAFSLVELSIVLLIIGIIIAGITQSSRLISQFRLSTARSQTQSSPVPSIKGLVAWYEATLEESFIESETEDNDLVSVTLSTWYDISPLNSEKNNAEQATEGFKPLYYANCINGLPCIRFDGGDDFLSFNGRELVGTDYTVFVVEQRRVGAAGMFIGSSTDELPGMSGAISFGYNTDTSILFAHSYSLAYYTIGVDSYLSPMPRFHSFVNSSIAAEEATVAHYLNGNLSAITPVFGGFNTGETLSSFEQAAIGAGYFGGPTGGSTRFNGDIAEVIIYNRPLKFEERTSVENYLSQKWKIR